MNQEALNQYSTWLSFLNHIAKLPYIEIKIRESLIPGLTYG
jgi:hypothetical protein